MNIRAETPGDFESIANLLREAFGGEGEVGLVADIRKSSTYIPALSFVAEERGEVRGHVMLSSLALERDGTGVPALSLAPVSVAPPFQRRGIGTALCSHALAEARLLGHGVVVLVGHPEFYPRFGFTPAGARGITVRWEVPPAAFMVLELFPCALPPGPWRADFPAFFDFAI